MNFTRISWFAGCAALVSFPVSISLSQASVVIAALTWGIASARREPDAPGFEAPLVLKLGVSLYVLQLLVLLGHSFARGDFSFAAEGLKRETKDVFLMAMAFWVLAFSRDANRQSRMLRLVQIGFAILIVSGLLAVFSKWRLSNIPYHLTHGWEGSLQARYQHHAGTFLAGTPLMFHIYIPVGLLHSHLTYGALLMMFIPVLFLRFMDPVIEKPASLRDRKVLLTGLVLMVCAGLFLINNARSAMVGTIFAVGTAAAWYSWLKWKKKSFLLLGPILAAIGVVALLFIFRDSLHERLAALVTALSGEEKHTDYQRVLLWHAARDLIRENWIFGVGPGHFQESVESVLLTMSQKQPGLWFANETLQRGHAHSDLLHFFAICGIGGIVVYLAFYAAVLREIGRDSVHPGLNTWRFSAIGLLPAGLYQCYMLDDAVLLPFWIMVGLLLRSNRPHEKTQLSQ